MGDTLFHSFIHSYKIYRKFVMGGQKWEGNDRCIAEGITAQALPARENTSYSVTDKIIKQMKCVDHRNYDAMFSRIFGGAEETGFRNPS